MGAVEFHSSFRPTNLQPAVVNAAGHRAVISDAEILRVIERAGDSVGAFPIQRVAIATGHYARGRGHVHVPVRDVDPVRHQIGQRASAEIPEPSPPEKLDRRNVLLRSLSEPHLLVEFVEREFCRVTAGGVVLEPPHPHESDLAELARIDDPFALYEMAPATLLRAGLDHALARFDGSDQITALLE